MTLQEDADEDLTPVDESEVSVEKGSPRIALLLGLERIRQLRLVNGHSLWNLGGWAPPGFRLMRRSDFAYGTEKNGWTLILMMRTLFTPATTLLRWKTSPLIQDNS